MKLIKGDLVLTKIQGKNVIGIIEYIMKDHVSIYISNSLKVQNGTYLVPVSEVRIV